MQLGTVGTYPVALGSLIALLILILVVVLWAIGQLEPRLALLIGGLALARLT
jgi:uncharacterized membrane protein